MSIVSKTSEISNKYHGRLFTSSFMILLLFFTAVYYDFYFFAAIDFCLFITSINYWNYPLKYSFERKLDLFMVFIWVISHNYESMRLSFDNQKIFFLLNLTGLFFYFTALYNDSDDQVSSIAHACLHCVGFIAMSYLYYTLDEFKKINTITDF